MDKTICAHCGEPIEEGTDEEWAEAEKELKDIFGDVPLSECVAVCDDCYQAMNPLTHPIQVMETIAYLAIKGVT